MTASQTRIRAVKEELRSCDSYRRLPTLLATKEKLRLTKREFLELLRDEWSGFDNVGLYPQLKQYLVTIHRRSPSLLKIMMTDEEKKRQAALPEKFEVYRGCYAINRNGMSYSTDIEVALAFPGLNRYSRKGETPILLTATVGREDCLVKSGDEAEIIVLRTRRKSQRDIGEEELAAAVASHNAQEDAKRAKRLEASSTKHR